MAESLHGPLAQAGPYEAAELAVERMLRGMLIYFRDEPAKGAQAPLRGARIDLGHVALPRLYGRLGDSGTQPASMKTLREDADRIVVLGSGHRFDNDAGPEYVQVEVVTETHYNAGTPAEALQRHEERVAAVRGILSGAGREGTVALAQANAADSSWTIYGWENLGAEAGFEEGAWTMTERVEVVMGLTGTS